MVKYHSHINLTNSIYSRYKTPKFMWDGFLSHIDKIKAERPEIYAKIEKLNSMSIDDAISK